MIRIRSEIRTRYLPNTNQECKSIDGDVLSRIWTVLWNVLLHFCYLRYSVANMHCILEHAVARSYLCRKMPSAQLLSCVPCCGVRTAAAAAREPLCCVSPIVWDVHLSFFLRWSLLPHLSTFSRISASFVRITCVSTPQSVLTASVTKVRILWDTEVSGQRRRLARSSRRSPVVRLTSLTQKTQKPCKCYGDSAYANGFTVVV